MATTTKIFTKWVRGGHKSRYNDELVTKKNIHPSQLLSRIPDAQEQEEGWGKEE
jgi:hypothetical protein